MTASSARAFQPPRHASKQDIRRELRERRAARAADGTAADAVADALARTYLAAPRTRLSVHNPPQGPSPGRLSVHNPPREERGGGVALYLSRAGEPGTEALRAALLGTGVRVLLPWLQEDRDLDWVSDPGPAELPGAPMRPPGDRLGLNAIHGVDVLLVPALAVDTAGRRLGQGGGSYDRVLARLAGTVGQGRPLVVACVHEDELLDARRHPLPEEPHDRRVDAVLTPTRYVDLAGLRASSPR
ncbi:MAG: 5-formyltetrahydrofolate cyclo-ligase [Kineosporiaceae bacterium]